MVGNDWDIILRDEYNKEYYQKMVKFLNNEYRSKTVFPLKSNIFKAFSLTTYSDTKVVILGQDPYHGINEANGLAFSVNDGIILPPSLKNIFKELNDDLGILNIRGDLSNWAKQGVLLLNTVLTVIKDTPASHKNIGWEIFTDEVIKILNKKQEPIVFILWGNFARSKKSFITNPKHLIIESSHPSPFSCRASFFGSRPFSKTNKFLKDNGYEEIDWKC